MQLSLKVTNSSAKFEGQEKFIRERCRNNRKEKMAYQSSFFMLYSIFTLPFILSCDHHLAPPSTGSWRRAALGVIVKCNYQRNWPDIAFIMRNSFKPCCDAFFDFILKEIFDIIHCFSPYSTLMSFVSIEVTFFGRVPPYSKKKILSTFHVEINTFITVTSQGCKGPAVQLKGKKVKGKM